MKTMKKLFTLILALMMVVSIAMPVMATGEVTDPHANHKITINGVPEKYKYEAYQIFDGTVAMIDTDNNPDTLPDLVLTDVAWGEHVVANRAVAWPGVEGTLNLLQALQSPVANPNSYQVYASLSFTNVTDPKCADAICEALSKNNSTVNGLAFADVVAKYLNTDAGIADVNHVISPLSDGYYLVMDVTDENDLDEGAVRSLFMLRLVEDANVTPKISTVDVDKQLIESSTTATHGDKNVGDVVEFEIRGKLPERLEEYDSFYYAFKDIMSEGLELIENSIKVCVVNNATTTEITDNNLYEIKIVTDDAGNTSLDVVFEDLLAVDASDSYTVQGTSTILLTYSATVTEKAVVGNPGNINKVHLEYTNDPHTDDRGKTQNKEVKVYTFGLDITKIDSKTNVVLSGAEFVLYRARQGGNQYAKVKETADGYVITGWTGTVPNELVQAYRDATAEDKAEMLEDVETAMGCTMADITVVSDPNGKVLINGLDTDRYWLLETKAPTGYEIDKAPKDFTISATYKENGELDKMILTPYGSDPVEFPGGTGVVAMNFVNNAGNTLPETGGIGTTLFYVFGGVLAAGALILLITKKRMAA